VRVLIVEDDALIGLMLEDELEAAGWGTVVACTAEAALREARAGPFDLALVDLGLPDMDGVELVRRLRAMAPGMPVVVCTGYPTGDAMMRRLPGGVAVLPKPCLASDLLRAVGAAVPRDRDP
jgi:DNA-binding response OmpR family regulator